MHRFVLCAAVVACAAARRPGSRIVQFTKRLPRRTRRAAETVVLDLPLGLLESRVERQLSKALGQAPVEHAAFQALRMVCGCALLFQSAKIPQTAATLQCFACLLQISHGLILGATGGGIDLFQSPARDDEGARVLFVVVRLCAWIVAQDIAERHGSTAAIAGVTIGVLAAKLAVATYDHARILARRQRKRIQAVRGLTVADEHEPPLDAITATLERLEMSYSDYVKQGLNWVVRTQVYARSARAGRGVVCTACDLVRAERPAWANVDAERREAKARAAAAKVQAVRLHEFLHMCVLALCTRYGVRFARRRRLGKRALDNLGDDMPLVGGGAFSPSRRAIASLDLVKFAPAALGAFEVSEGARTLRARNRYAALRAGLRATNVVETYVAGDVDSRGRRRSKRGMLKQFLALFRALTQTVNYLTSFVNGRVRAFERWLLARRAYIRFVWRFVLAPIFVVKGLQKPFLGFYKAVAAECYPWLLAWSGWRVQLGTLELHQVPAYMTWAAALPARWLAVMVRSRGGGGGGD
jgi:hypothetical protein